MMTMMRSFPEHDILLELCKRHLNEVIERQQGVFDLLLAQAEPLPLEIGELFEDAANVYLRISDEISARYLGGIRSKLSLLLETASVSLEVG
jgi:hypothetical protein